MIYLGKNIDDWKFIENFLSRNILARFTFFIISGVCCSYYVGLSYNFNFWISSIALVLLALLYIIFKGDARRTFFYTIFFNLFVALFFVAFGGMLAQNKLSSVKYDWDESELLYKVRIKECVKLAPDIVQYRSCVLSQYNNDTLEAINRDVFIYFFPDSNLCVNYGDEFLVRATINLPKNDKLSNFDYRKYLFSKGISATAFVKNEYLYKLQTEKDKSILGYANKLQAKLSNHILNSNISQENYTIVSSIFLGDKRALSKTTKAMFSASGASHVLAVSGMHVGILYGIYLLFFSHILKRRKFKWRFIFHIILLIIIWIYAFVTGLSPSVVRASLMFSLCLIDNYLFSSSFDGRVIAYSALIMIFYNPLVVFDLGFQLSFAAVISIIIFTPYVTRHFKFSSAAEYKVFQIFLIPIVAQLGSFPLVLLYFHQFPLYFILSNLLVVIIAPIIMYGALFMLAFSWSASILHYSSLCINLLVDFFRESINYISYLPKSTLGCWIEWEHVLLLYLLIIYLFLIIRKLTVKRVAYFLSICILSVVLIYELSNMSVSSNILMIPRNKPITVNVIRGDNNIVYARDSLLSSALMRSVWLERGDNKESYHCGDSLKDNCFNFDGLSYLILKKEAVNGKYNLAAKPLEVDVLVVDSGIYPSMGVFTKFVHARERIICTHGVSMYYLDMYENLADSLSVDFYSVRRSGSYILEKREKLSSLPQ